MAVENDSALDGIPLLDAVFSDNVLTFQEKVQEVRRRGIWRLISRIRFRPSFRVLIPSFLDRSTESKPAHPTAWLDGIRGIASFFVFIYHFQHLYHNTFYKGYHSHEGNNDYWVIQMPIIRLIFTGAPMVSIFWVLSGISLSLKPIQLARNQAWDKFAETMYSSIFRRWLRLYMPVLTVQFCVLLATLMGLYNRMWELHNDWHYGGTNEGQHELKDTNYAQIADWTLSMWKLINPFKPFRPLYDVHLWTIPLEFRNSIILFATLVGFAKLKASVRIALTLSLYLYLVIIEEGDVALFIAGMAMAEYLLIRDEKTKRLPSAEKPQPVVQSIRTKVIWTAVFLVGLFLLSIPAGRYEYTPGYRTLVRLARHIVHNQEVSIQRIGAAPVLLALCGCDYLRKPFSTPLAIYLGKISFPLYIVHGPITHILGIRLVPFFWSIVGDTSLFQYEVGFILAFITEAVVVVWVADLVMRTIDTPSVRFGRTLQNWWSV